jgi:dihydroxyacetone kinase
VQKIINAPDSFVDESLGAILSAHPRALRASAEDARAILRAEGTPPGKVAIVTGGGSGHLPLFLGYVGHGLADAVAVGNVFASPSADEILAATRASNAGAGTLYLFGNYGGDTMNFGLAAELAEAEGIRVETIKAADDVASAPKDEANRRRGIAGIFFLYKIAGAAAETGASLEDVARTTRHAARNLRSAGVAIAPCTVPAAGRPTFEVAAGEMEIGMGLHGEPGVRHAALGTANEIADELVDLIYDDIELTAGDSVDVLVNGLGATPLEELYLVYGRASERLQSRGVTIRRAWVGEYATSLEMSGASLSILRTDEELALLLDAPAHSPFISIQ